MTLDIPENDHGQIRIFQFKGTLPPEVLEKSPHGIEGVLGTPDLDPTYIDIVKISDLSSMPLSDYIRQGYDMEPAEHDVSAINSIEGYAILILSSASRGQAVTLAPVLGLRHITTVLPEVQLTPVDPLHSNAATGGTISDPVARPKKSDARVGGMIAMYALVAMFALVGLMIWIAG